ncbi:MAG: DUF4007 family protein [Bacteroidota bacterium]
MGRLLFTGHETFYCRTYWLKKGLDHLWADEKFNDQAVVNLGVGKNMVFAIRFWLRAFGLLDKEDQPNELAELLFGEVGLDSYCEDIATLWLLHYSLVKTSYSSIYHLVFHDFRKQRIEFTRERLLDYLERYCTDRGVNFHTNSLKKDIGVFLNNYITPSKSKSIEDNFIGLLHELKLVERLDKSGGWYKIENGIKADLPYQIFLFALLDTFKDSETISIPQIQQLASTFTLDSDGLKMKIDAIVSNFSNAITFTEDAGVSVLQLKKPINRWEVLKDYYAA